VRNPIFTLTAALSLAIGIGATTTIFTVANGLLLRSAVGVSDPDRLVDISRTENRGGPGIDPVSYPDYLEVRRRATTLEGVYGYQLELQPASLRLENTGAERVYPGVVTTNYFEVLGVSAIVGRTFGMGDGEEAGSSPVVVLSHRFWARRFGSDPGVVGRTLYLNGYPFTVVGVVPEGFLGMTVVAPDVWVPASMIAALNPESGGRLLVTRGADWMMLGGRLKPGVSRAQASAQIVAVGAALAREFPVKYDFLPPGIGPTDLSFFWSAEPSSPIPAGLRVVVAGFLTVLMSIVSVVLVIACANLAGVLLARGVVRRREIAVRTAMGAGRGRVVRQLLTETTLLFAVGGLAGLLMARVLTSLLVSLLPAFPVPVNVSVPLDERVVAFSLLTSFVAALFCGLAPALHASKADVVSALKDDAPVPADRLRLRNAFVVAQVAFSVVLVITAAILVRDVDRVTSVDRGFDSRQVDVASVNLSMAGYTATTGSAFARQLIERVRAIPGVEAASLSDRQPDPGSMMMGGLTVDGVSPPQGQPYFYPNWNVVDSHYFATLRIPLLAGRDFADADRVGSQPVAIIGESAAKRFFPGKSALGQVVHVHTGNLNAPGSPSSALVVVGVARDVQVTPNLAPRLNLYVPMQQKYVSGITVLARTTGPTSVADDIRALVTSMNPSLPVLVAQTLDSLGRGPVETQLRVAATVAGSVGLIGLLLAAMGIYGVTAYTVARRTREIGIRLSLGAGRSAVVGMILRQGMTLVGIGLGIGLALSVGVGRMLAAQRFGITPPGVATFAAATMLFVVVALIACYAPLRRAVRIGAMDALRYE
ncbi:MAG TPA: ABC transporter permease, partial [Vicinamibacterales bacterium]|nr:ABC transporter permease [Vicinamibacterales bacterium]